MNEKINILIESLKAFDGLKFVTCVGCCRIYAVDGRKSFTPPILDKILGFSNMFNYSVNFGIVDDRLCVSVYFGRL